MKAEFALVEAHMSKLEIQHKAVVARAARWKQLAFMWCSFSIILAAVILLAVIIRSVA